MNVTLPVFVWLEFRDENDIINVADLFFFFLFAVLNGLGQFQLSLPHCIMFDKCLDKLPRNIYFSSGYAPLLISKSLFHFSLFIYLIN